jgi:excisionase family DNA binding protein
MGMNNLPDIVTVKELAEFLKTSDQTIKRALKRGDLEGFKVGGYWRLEKEAVIKWIDSNKVKIAKHE